MIRLWDKNYEKRISDRKDESFWDVIEEIYFLNLTELWYGYICLCVYVQILWIWTDNLSHFSILQRGSNKLLKIQDIWSMMKKIFPLNFGWQSFPPAKTRLDSYQWGESGPSNKVSSPLVSSMIFESCSEMNFLGGSITVPSAIFLFCWHLPEIQKILPQRSFLQNFIKQIFEKNQRDFFWSKIKFWRKFCSYFWITWSFKKSFPQLFFCPKLHQQNLLQIHPQKFLLGEIKFLIKAFSLYDLPQKS